jgi:hypothetical protein
MKLISNKGNITGKLLDENNPAIVESAINIGYDVKIDLWLQENQLYLGTDKPEYKLDIDWLEKHHHKLWLHCHDLEIINKFYALDPMGVKLNYFHMESDILVRSSKWYNIMQLKNPINGCVFMNPENHPEYDFSQCFGIISNSVAIYR